MSRWTRAALPSTSPTVLTHNAAIASGPAASRRRRLKTARISVPYSFLNEAGYSRRSASYASMFLNLDAYSRTARRKSPSARHPDELRQPARFRFRDRRAQRRDPVIPPPLVVFFRSWPFARFDEQSLLEHALNRPIERAGAELQLAFSPYGHILDDGVAVPVFFSHRQQDVEGRWRKRQQFIDFVLVDHAVQSSSL